MRVAGIDPGLKGALVVLGESKYCATLPMPLQDDRKSIDGEAIAAWLLAEEPDLVVVEKVGARNHLGPGGRVVRKAGNEFRFATGYGVILGVLQAMGLPYRLVTPMVWKAKVLGGYGTDKEAAIAFVQDNYPQVDLTPRRCRVPQDGIADAACLAVYGRRHMR